MSTLTIPASELLWSLTTASAFAGTDKQLPAFRGVHIHAEQGCVPQAVATDRYVAARVNIGTEPTPDTADVTVPLDTVKEWVRALKSHHGATVTIIGADGLGLLRLTTGDVDITGSGVPVTGAEFPCHKLVKQIEGKASAETDTDAVPPVFGAHNLAQLGKVKHPNGKASVAYRFGSAAKGKSVRFTALPYEVDGNKHHRLEGLIMQMRVPD